MALRTTDGLGDRRRNFDRIEIRPAVHPDGLQLRSAEHEHTWSKHASHIGTPNYMSSETPLGTNTYMPNQNPNQMSYVTI